MGGYDLYGNYYPRTQDALNAEDAQCAMISAQCAEQEFKQQDRDISWLRARVEQLEQKVEKLYGIIANNKQHGHAAGASPHTESGTSA